MMLLRVSVPTKESLESTITIGNVVPLVQFLTPASKPVAGDRVAAPAREQVDR
jgi:hypothetical protein